MSAYIGTTGSTNQWVSFTATANVATTSTWYALFNDTYVTLSPLVTDEMVQRALINKLTNERKLLLEYKTVRVPKFNFCRLIEHGQTALDIEHEVLSVGSVDGYILEKNRAYVLPDGVVLRIDADGNYGIYDEEAVVVYRSNRVREFNPFINCSDLLEKFIEEMGGKYGVAAKEVLQLPVNIFIHWLVLQAALKDGDDISRLPKLDDVVAPHLRLSKLEDEKVELVGLNEAQQKLGVLQS